jgi:hypothetical protein
MSADADADDYDNKHNDDATNKLTNNHVDVDIVNDWNNDSHDFR